MTDQASTAEQTEQRDTPPTTAEPAPAVASTGPGQIFRNITHALTDLELTNPAVIKLILDRMHAAEQQRDEFRQYVALYHERDKKVGVFEEKLKTNTANEIMFGVGLTLGGAIFGVAPYFWDKGNNDHLAGGSGAASRNNPLTSFCSSKSDSREHASQHRRAFESPYMHSRIASRRLSHRPSRQRYGVRQRRATV